jgi:hypothetical protein
MPARKRQIVLFLLILTHVLAGVAAVNLTYRFDNGPALRQMFPSGFLFASASLLGVWAAMGMARFHVRLSCCVIGILFISYLYMVLRSRGLEGWYAPSLALTPVRRSSAYSGEPFNLFRAWLQSTLLMGAIATFVCGCLRLQRRFILRPVDDVRPFVAHERFQFSLRTALLFTLAAGLISWIVRTKLSLTTSTSQEVRLAHLILGLSLGFATATAAVLWVTLGPGNPLRRFPVAMTAAAANGLLLTYFVNGGGQSTSFMSRSYIILAASHASCVAFALLVVRWCGCRLHITAGI